MLRLRQVVVAARDLEGAVEELLAALPLGAPHADPGVALFGLRNAVMALGDTFVEVVSPEREDTAAGRFLERRGPGPYMAMFQVDDLAGARARAERLGVREVWSIELDDISAVHLHPRDLGGAIVSLDCPRPPESWRWAGPEWTGRAGAPGPGECVGLTLAARDPEALGGRWRAVLGDLELDRGRIDVRAAAPDEPEGIAAFHVALPAAERRGRDVVQAAGARFELR